MPTNKEKTKIVTNVSVTWNWILFSTSHFHERFHSILITLLVLLNSCGVSWQQDHVSLDCRECGGYAMARPCPDCNGTCQSEWRRNLAAVSDYYSHFFFLNFSFTFLYSNPFPKVIINRFDHLFFKQWISCYPSTLSKDLNGIYLLFSFTLSSLSLPFSLSTILQDVSFPFHVIKSVNCKDVVLPQW